MFSSILSKLALEKSNFRRTEVETEDALSAGLEGEFGPREGFLRAGDCKNVLIGDFDRGGGNRILACLRSLRTTFGSGMEPMQSQHQNRMCLPIIDLLSSTSTSSSLVSVPFEFLFVPFTLCTDFAFGFSGEENMWSIGSRPFSSRIPVSGRVRPVFLFQC